MPALTQRQLLAAIALAGTPVSKASPLAGLSPGTSAGEMAAGDRAALRKGGWLAAKDPPALSPAGREMIEALCRPAAHVSLIMGTRDTLGVVNAYAARPLGDGPLVSFSPDPERDEYRVLGEQPRSRFGDMLMIQLAGPAREPCAFQANADPLGLVTVLCILDWQLNALLQAMIDRELDPPSAFTAHGLWEMLVKGRISRDLGWMATLFPVLLPSLDYELDEPALARSLDGLAANGVVVSMGDGRFSAAGSLAELSDALLPCLAYAAVGVEHYRDSAGIERTSLAFVRGRSALLATQPVAGAAGELLFTLDCIDEKQLDAILCGIGLPPAKLEAPGQGAPAASPPAPPPASPDARSAAARGVATCPACGAPVQSELNFCVGCGARLAAADRPRGVPR